ncbi:hypothetical protein H7097_04305 [Aeromicrobium sp.]|nr:hypothetical protein [Candidatus Saccharibacteria bacterium]
MSDYEKLSVDAIFFDLMSSSGMTTYDPGTACLPMVPMNSGYVRLNPIQGEALHDVLRDAETASKLHFIQMGMKIDRSTLLGEHVKQAMNASIEQSTAGDAFGELFSVEGPGWFGIKKPGESVPLTDCILGRHQRIFGTLATIAAGTYHEVDPTAVDEFFAVGKQPDSKKPIGGFIGIKDVVICGREMDSLGRIDQSYSTIFLPVGVETFSWSRVYPVM